MKKALPTIIGTVIGVVIAVPLTLFLTVHFLTGASMRTTVANLLTSALDGDKTPAAASPSAGSFTPEGAALKQALIDDLAEMNQQAFKPPPQVGVMLQSLTPADMQALLPIAAQEAAMWQKAGSNPNPPRPQFDMKAVHAISPQAVFAVSLVIAHVDKEARAAQAKAAENAAAVNLSGAPTPPGGMTADQAAAYRQEAATNTFQTPIEPSNLEPVLRNENDPEKTEDDWLSSLIVQEIVGQVIAGFHLQQAPKTVMPVVTVNVDDEHAKIQVRLLQWLDDPQLESRRFNQELPLEFAWDGAGYSVVAEYLCERHNLPPATPDPKAADLLLDLLDLNGPRLAKEDVRISTLLEQNALDASAQGEAALLLAAMAWRENAGIYSDNRRVLCKATAHLALALALDGLNKQPPDWNAQIANIALRTLAGRETDTLGRIDALTTQAGLPDAAKTWLSALRLWSTHDWRPAKINTQSSLLEKIVWFQVLCDDLTDIGATRQLDEAGPLAKVPDWGRALMSQHELSVENGNRFAQATLALEMQEANEVNQAENQPAFPNEKALACALAAPEDETTTIGPDGHPDVRVIGPNTFLAASQRHILNAIQNCDYWMRCMIGLPDEAAQFEAQVTSTFGDLPHFLLVSHAFPTAPGAHRDPIATTLRERSAQWYVSELPPGLLFDRFDGLAEFKVLNDFYQAGEPVGTVYDFDRRSRMIERLHIDPRWHLPGDAPSGTKATLVKRAYFQLLQMLNPDSYALAQAVIEADDSPEHGETPAQKMTALKRFMDYRVAPCELLLDDRNNPDLDNADLETIYNKEAALEPDVYFRLGKLLRREGREEDAAEADRKGAAQAFDQVGVSNSLQPLVEYDLAHGKPDEALDLAKRAADVFSEQGLATYIFALEKLNKLDEAETCAKDLRDRYNNRSFLDQLYASYPNHFPAPAAALEKEIFPNGKMAVALTSFTAAPEKGLIITSSSQRLIDAGLNEGDIIVALNSNKVENSKQYDFLREQLSGPDMDLIIWQHGQYHEIHTSPPDHQFQVTMSDYPSH